MPKKIPLVERIKCAENVHGKGRYDYSLITEDDYKSAYTDVSIKCNKCEEVFPQSLYIHIGRKQGCPNCKKKEMRQKNYELFLKKAKEVHGDKYDYSKVEYVNANTNVLIGCKTCGDIFLQSPSNHLQGQGCSNCNRYKKGSLESFIEKARKVHGDKYDYSKVVYVNSQTNVIIKCNDCGDVFPQTPSCHLQGHGCPNCSKVKRMTTESFIERARKIYGNKYDYSKVNYIDAMTDVIIKCNDCDYEFEVTPNAHLNTHKGCPVCTKSSYMNTDIFIRKAKKVHGNDYDYSKVNYINSKTDVILICNSCHKDFPQTPEKHLSGCGCPHCKASNGEKEIARLLELKDIKFTSEYRFNDCRDKYPLPFDFYLPKYNICIEYDGIQHYKPLEVFGGEKRFINQQKHDSIKTNYCKQNNIPLLRIRFDENIETKLNQFLSDKLSIEPQSIFDL